MIYVEWLRARKRLIIFAAVLSVLVALVMLCIEFGYTHGVRHHYSFYLTLGTSHSSGDQPARVLVYDALQRSPIQLDALLEAAAGAAFIFCIALYTSLHAQRDSLHLVWTKPISRTRLALGFFMVDGACIAALYAFVVALGLAILGVFGGLGRIVAPDSAALGSLGGVVLLYGLMQMSTALMRGNCGGIVGAIWFTFFTIPSLALTPIAVVNGVARALLPLDPLQYLSMHPSNDAVTAWSSHASNVVTWGLGDTLGAAALLGLALGIAACAVAIVFWNRVEV